MGNTLISRPTTPRHPVHPHMRGEYSLILPFGSMRIGSSPHAWGIRNEWSTRQTHSRFIPTCVGNTLSFLFFAPLITVRRPFVGSSPHAWGIPFFISPISSFVRFIPTCVGNTFPSLIFLPLRPVHPHMRGEYFRVNIGYNAALGSSPHAWGILLSPLSRRSLLRFIPTCVGNTVL